MLKKFLSLVCCIAVLCGAFFASASAQSYGGQKKAAWDYLQKHSDDITLPYYCASVINDFSPTNGQILHLTNEIGSKDEASLAELSGAIVALGAVKQDPSNINSVNLFSRLDQRNLNGVFPNETQGLFLSIAAVHLFPDSFSYEKWNGESLLETLLSFQNEDGGFPNELGGASDVYLTQYALLGLSFYSSQQAAQARSRAVEYLAQSEFSPKTGMDTALLVQALSAAGVSNSDSRFLIGGKTPVALLLSFTRDDGGFAQTPSAGESSVTATQEALLALYAAEHLQNPFDLAAIAPAYQPPDNKLNTLTFFGKFLLVLGIIYISLMIVSRYGKKRAAISGPAEAAPVSLEQDRDINETDTPEK